MSDNLQKDSQVIFCDMCIEEDRKPAHKTCMKCEISMCVQHLQAHLTTPVLLQTHPLTEPMASGDGGLGGITKCLLHGKLLEYYCLDDMTCVCVSCAIEDQHRLHNMKTFSSAHRELMEKLSAEQQDLLVKTEDVNVSLEKWEKAERERLGRSSVRLIEAVTNMRDIALTSVQSSVSARMVSIRTSKSSMEVAQKEKDTFRFLQMFSQVYQDLENAKAVDLRKGLEAGIDRDKLVKEIRQGGEKMVEQAINFWGSLLILVDPENHQEAFTTGSDLIFNPQSLGAAMSLSKDKRQVYYNSWLGQCSATLLISNTLPVSNLQRWLISLPKDCDWTIGLCDKESAKNLKNGCVYGLSCQGNQLSSLTVIVEQNNDCLKASKTSVKKCQVFSELITYQGENEDEFVPERVEVFWDFAASSLSFFSRTGNHQRVKILTMKMSLNNWDLSPFVQLGDEKAQNHPSLPHEHHPSSTWRCSCGTAYDKTPSGYTGGCFGRLFNSCATCSCGEFIGGLNITEMLCELL